MQVLRLHFVSLRMTLLRIVGASQVDFDGLSFAVATLIWVCWLKATRGGGRMSVRWDSSLRSE